MPPSGAVFCSQMCYTTDTTFVIHMTMNKLLIAVVSLGVLGAGALVVSQYMQPRYIAPHVAGEKIAGDFDVADAPDDTSEADDVVVRCNDLDTLKARVECRLQAVVSSTPSNDVAEPMPEECRVLTSGAQEHCESLRHKTDQCLLQPVGTKRAACAMQTLGLGKKVSSILQPCEVFAGNDRTICERAGQEKIAAMVDFRLNDLIDRASTKLASGASVQAVAAVVAALEQAKQDMRVTKTLAERTQVLTRARAAWKQFAQATRDKKLTNDYLAPAFVDIKSL